MPVQQLSTYAEFEERQNALMQQMKKHDLECVACPTCSSEFFEQVQVYKLKADHQVILGQEVPPKPGSQPYILLRCIYCKNLLEPRVLSNTRDILGGDYEDLLDTCEGKRDSRTEGQMKRDAIPSQEL